MAKHPSKLNYLWLVPMIFAASSYFLWGIMFTFLPRWTLSQDLPWCLGFATLVTVGSVAAAIFLPAKEEPTDELL